MPFVYEEDGKRKMLYTRFQEHRILEPETAGNRFFRLPYLNDSKYDNARAAILNAQKPVRISSSRAYKYDFDSNTLETSPFDTLSSAFDSACSPVFNGKHWTVITTHLRQRRILYTHQQFDPILGWGPTFWNAPVTAYRTTLANDVNIGASFSTECDVVVLHPNGDRIGYLFHLNSNIVRMAPVFGQANLALITFHLRDQEDFHTLLFHTETGEFSEIKIKDKPVYKSSIFQDRLYYVERQGADSDARMLRYTDNWKLHECDFKIAPVKTLKELEYVGNAPSQIIANNNYQAVRAAVIDETAPCFFEGCEQLRVDYKKALTRSVNCSNCERNAIIGKFIRIGLNALK